MIFANRDYFPIGRFPRQLPLRQKGWDSVRCSSSSASTGALDAAGPPGSGSGGGGGGFGGSGGGAGEGEDDDDEELVDLEEVSFVPFFGSRAI